MTGAVAGPSAFGQALTDLRKPLVRQCVLLVPMALDLVVLLLWGSPEAVGTFYVIASMNPALIGRV